MQSHFYIYISIVFQWYKEFFNPMNFDPSNCSLMIRKSLKTPTPKVGINLGMCEFIPSHCSAFPGMWMWLLGCIFNPHLSMPLALVANPKLGLWHTFVANHWILRRSTFIAFMVGKGWPHMMLCNLLLWSLQEIWNFMSCKNNFMSFHPHFTIFALSNQHCQINRWCPHINKHCHHQPIWVDLVSRFVLSHGIVTTIVV